MAKTPWVTSDSLIENVKRQISFPFAQSTFSDDDILGFANSEMSDGMLPNILQYHEEFFVVSSSIPLEMNRSVYPIPNRAIGMRLRDVFYGDNTLPTPSLPYGNLFEMSRINPDDKAWFQTGWSANSVPYKYYIKGNNVVVIPAVTGTVTGLIVFDWFMRPNQLVTNDQAMIINGFSKNITLTNSAIVAGDTITLTLVESSTESTVYVFTAVAGAPGPFEFQIAATSTLTTTNLTAAINSQNIAFTANNGGTSPTNTVKILYAGRQNTLATSNDVGFVIQTTINLESATTIPGNIIAGSLVDLLQTLPGHKTLNYDVLVPTGGVSGSSLTLNESSVPFDMIPGDYVCSVNECIIPQIPPELHSQLVDRTCAKVLAAIGDKEGLAVQKADIAEKSKTDSVLIDNRVDGSPLKVLNRQGLLRSNGWFRRGRF